MGGRVERARVRMAADSRVPAVSLRCARGNHTLLSEVAVEVHVKRRGNNVRCRGFGWARRVTAFTGRQWLTAERQGCGYGRWGGSVWVGGQGGDLRHAVAFERRWLTLAAQHLTTCSPPAFPLPQTLSNLGDVLVQCGSLLYGTARAVRQSCTAQQAEGAAAAAAAVGGDPLAWATAQEAAAQADFTAAVTAYEGACALTDSSAGGYLGRENGRGLPTANCPMCESRQWGGDVVSFGVGNWV